MGGWGGGRNNLCSGLRLAWDCIVLYYTNCLSGWDILLSNGTTQAASFEHLEGDVGWDFWRTIKIGRRLGEGEETIEPGPTG